MQEIRRTTGWVSVRCWCPRASVEQSSLSSQVNLSSSSARRALLLFSRKPSIRLTLLSAKRTFSINFYKFCFVSFCRSSMNVECDHPSSSRFVTVSVSSSFRSAAGSASGSFSSPLSFSCSRVASSSASSLASRRRSLPR